MKNIFFLVLSVVLLILLAGCAPGATVQVNTSQATFQLSAPGPNPMLNQGDTSGRISRAGAGLWHGVIAPITLVISFFTADVHMYEVHNAGSEYDLGFLLGVILIFSVLGIFIRMRR